MIYFDNAATGGFKPYAVTESVSTAIKYLLANPGRSGHRLSIAGAKAVYDCRTVLGEFFSADPDRVIFTKNCTEALNLAIFGTAINGGHVITTVYEHNSVLRPLFYLKNKGVISLDTVKPENGKTITQAISEKIRDDTYLICVTAVSNVTGEALPLEQIGALAKEKKILFLVDGAQGAGHLSIDLKKQNISMLALAGHKGLYGVMGSGALIIDDVTEVEPIIHGGSGSETFNVKQPRCYPERLEAGTINLPAVMGLAEGVRFIKNNLNNFSSHLLKATASLVEKLSKIPNVKLYSEPNLSGIVSFAIDKIPSTDVADILNRDYDVAVRGGFHCAPLMHEFLNTKKDGLVRASLAVQNSSNEIEYFIKSINSIATR